jgi:hypothetical protein
VRTGALSSSSSPLPLTKPTLLFAELPPLQRRYRYLAAASSSSLPLVISLGKRPNSIFTCSSFAYALASSSSTSPRYSTSLFTLSQASHDLRPPAKEVDALRGHSVLTPVLSSPTLLSLPSRFFCSVFVDGAPALKSLRHHRSPCVPRLPPSPVDKPQGPSFRFSSSSSSLALLPWPKLVLPSRVLSKRRSGAG